MVKVSYTIFHKFPDFCKIEREVKKVEEAGVDYLHLDVMDGHFVPNILLGHEIVRSIRGVTKLPFDVHLMVDNPDNHIEQFAKAGSYVISVHAEACTHLHCAIQRIKNLGKKAGVALNPATPLSVIKYVLDDLDMVLVMTVNPGFYGQTFIPSMLNKISKLRKLVEERDLNIEIEVDGGINQKTATLAVKAGANVLVLGSALVNQKDIKKTIEMFKRLA